jgi:NAD(P)-dependent dehydrogenase (short-subunit alcohol dehydrogenase family)
MPNPNNRTIVVTGGTRRLGKSLSEAAAEHGYDIVATYSDHALSGTAELASFKTAIEAAHGVTCALVHADFSDPAPAVIAAIFDACPSPLFGLINNAGMFQWDDLKSLDRAQCQEIISVNLLAPMLVTSEFSKRLAATNAPGIALFMLDQKVFNPYPDHLTYTVCKGALNMLVTMCAREPGHAVKFYGLAPGLTIPAPGQSTSSFLAAQKNVPMGLSPTPEDIKRCAKFLLGGSAANGYVLLIDGGASLITRERDFAFFAETSAQ